MPSGPKFSIVVTTFNLADYVGETIDSVLAQSEASWELLVTDDESSDNTWKVLCEYDDSRIQVACQTHGGLNSARLNGLQRARGDYIVILDGDDKLRPEALATFRRLFEQDAGIGVVLGQRALCDHEGRIIGHPRRWRPRRPMNGYVLDRVLMACPATTPGQVAFRRSCLADAGGYPSSNWECGDWYLLALLAAVAEFAESREVVLDYRLRKDSLARGWGRRAGDGGEVNLDEFEPMIAELYESPKIKSAFTRRKLDRLQTRSRAQAFCIKGYECLRTRQWSTARRYLLEALRRYPFNATACTCLLFACVEWMPGFLRPSIGHA